MSTQIPPAPDTLAGAPDLSPLGIRIEMLRIRCGVSKQQLARAAGVSRQQLWRVLCGKSELTSSLCERLAAALRTDSATLRAGDDVVDPIALAEWVVRGRGARPTGDATPLVEGPIPIATFERFVESPDALRAALAALPACEDGVSLKRALLDAIETVAIARKRPLGAAYFEARRAVVAGDL